MDRSFVTAPLRLARAPWQRLDRALADRLPDNHLARRAIQGVLRASESAIASAQRPTGPDVVVPAPDPASPTIASPQRKRATAAKERATARGNRSPKSIVQDIAKIDAAAAARDHEAAAHNPTDAPGAGS